MTTIDQQIMKLSHIHILGQNLQIYKDTVTDIQN